MAVTKKCPPGCTTGNHRPWCPGVAPNRETHEACGDEIARLRAERDEAREIVTAACDVLVAAEDGTPLPKAVMGAPTWWARLLASVHYRCLRGDHLAALRKRAEDAERGVLDLLPDPGDPPAGERGGVVNPHHEQALAALPAAGDVEAAKRLLTYIHEQMTGARPEEWEWRLMEKLGLPAYVTRLLAAQREQGFTEGWDLAHMPAVCGHARANYKDPKYGTIEYAGEEECEACAHLEPWVGLLREARAMISRALDWYMDDEPERDELTARIDAALAALDGEGD